MLAGVFLDADLFQFFRCLDASGLLEVLMVFQDSRIHNEIEAVNVFFYWTTEDYDSEFAKQEVEDARKS